MWFPGDQWPCENGYYLTYYYNEEIGQNMFKAFWFNCAKKEWCKPRPDFPLEGVKSWWNVRHDYYIPCQMQEGVAPLPNWVKE